jgi:CheY-like chemotaxis protein
LIVSDLAMPELAGRELCDWLRAQSPARRLPIVLCANAPGDELVHVAARADADAYVSKQEGLDGLPARLRAICEEFNWA